MDWLQRFSTEQFVLFTLVLTRVSGLVMTAPVYGTKDIPMQVRALLAFTLALLITPTQWNRHVEYPETTPNYMVFVGSELLVGVVLALGIVVLFSGAYLAGEMIGRVSGLMMANVFDPSTDSSVSTFARFTSMVTLALFVCLGGHRILMAALLDTFESLPVGCAAFPESLADTFVALLTEAFKLGIRAGTPVVLALLLSTFVMGLISRTLPQLNIMMVGFGTNSLLTYGTLSLTIGGAAWVFQEQVEPTLRMLLDTLHLPLVKATG